MTGTDPAEPQARLYNQLVSTGALPPEWRPAYWLAPRHRLIPDRIWLPGPEGALTPLDRSTDPAGWMTTAYADDYVITQVDDGAAAEGTGHGITSSASMPSIVFDMLRRLDVRPGQRVLEIGTGTGWNAALLTNRLGDALVTTVEVDEALAERARRALAAAGFRPTVVARDGASGHPPNAPYDRVLSTAAVRRVPYAWVEQTAPGGRILTPYGTVWDNGALLELTVGTDGTARGRFVCLDIAFMWLRRQRPTIGMDTLTGAVAESFTDLSPRLFLGPPALFPIGLRLPDVAAEFVPEPDSDEYTIVFTHEPSGSWATQSAEFGLDDFRIRQHGPRRLWDEVEAAYRWWVGAERPGYRAFEVTVGPTGQVVRLGDDTVLDDRPS